MKVLQSASVKQPWPNPCPQVLSQEPLQHWSPSAQLLPLIRQGPASPVVVPPVVARVPVLVPRAWPVELPILPLDDGPPVPIAPPEPGAPLVPVVEFRLEPVPVPVEAGPVGETVAVAEEVRDPFVPPLTLP